MRIQSTEQGDLSRGPNEAITNSLIPLKKVKVSFKELTAGLEGITSPIEELTAGLKDISIPFEDLIAGLEDISFPVKDLTVGFEDISFPIKDLTAGLEDISFPFEDLIAGLEDISFPVKDLTTGLEDISFPVKDLTIGLEDISSPIEELTAGLEDISFPIKELIAGLEDTTSPIKDITSRIEEEIEIASFYLETHRRENECISISEGIWNYSKGLLRSIFTSISNELFIGFQVPKFNFIDDSILIRWEKRDSKLVLSLSDHTTAIAVNLKDKKGQYITGYIHKNEIVDWVTFWLKKLNFY